jgi:hypothetical protein
MFSSTKFSTEHTHTHTHTHAPLKYLYLSCFVSPSMSSDVISFNVIIAGLCLLFHNNSQVATLLIPTSMVKLQVFFRCDIYCNIYIYCIIFWIFIVILLLYCGYIVTFIKVLTLYLSQIHPLHHFPLSQFLE